MVKVREGWLMKVSGRAMGQLRDQSSSRRKYCVLSSRATKGETLFFWAGGPFPVSPKRRGEFEPAGFPIHRRRSH